jgi:hypothetical protein
MDVSRPSATHRGSGELGARIALYRRYAARPGDTVLALYGAAPRRRDQALFATAEPRVRFAASGANGTWGQLRES